MVKKDETDPNAVDSTDAAPVAEVAVEAVSEAPATVSDGPAVVGAITDPTKFVTEPANICVECGSVWPIDKGVASCPACGGKTVTGFKHQAKSLVESDNARFTGETAVAPKPAE